MFLIWKPHSFHQVKIVGFLSKRTQYRRMTWKPKAFCGSSEPRTTGTNDNVGTQAPVDLPSAGSLTDLSETLDQPLAKDDSEVR
jgi:hypothetical protein